jgi:hypothetical protein
MIKALPELYRVQSQMHSQQAQDVSLNQMEVVNASPAIAARQGTDMQIGAPKEGADTTGVENGTWSSDVLLVLLDLPYDGVPSTTVTLDTPFGASGYQCTSMEAETEYERAQPSNIQEVANPGEMSARVVHPLATATGSVEHGQPVAPTGSRGGATTVDHDMTIPQESGGQADTEMSSATSGVGHDQALQGLDGGVHSVPAISLVGKGVEKLMSSSCLTLLNFIVITYTSISAKRSTSHTDVVRQSLAPGSKPRRDSEQWILAGIQPHIEQLLFRVFLTKPTYKIWPSWA